MSRQIATAYTARVVPSLQSDRIAALESALRVLAEAVDGLATGICAEPREGHRAESAARAARLSHELLLAHGLAPRRPTTEE